MNAPDEWSQEGAAKPPMSDLVCKAQLADNLGRSSGGQNTCHVEVYELCGPLCCFLWHDAMLVRPLIEIDANAGAQEAKF